MSAWLQPDMGEEEGGMGGGSLCIQPHAPAHSVLTHHDHVGWMEVHGGGAPRHVSKQG